MRAARFSAGAPLVTPESGVATRPLPYVPTVEQPEPDEHETIRDAIETLRSISEKVFEDHGHGMRGVHAKCHGIVVGELTVAENLAPELAQGLFERAGRYPLVMRFSTTPGDPLDDSVSLPRGLSIKIIGVSGERVPGSENETTQDFVLVNGPTFLAKTAQSFLRGLKLLAKTTDHAEPLKKGLSTVLRGAEKVVEAFGGESGTLKSLGGHPATDALGETFYSQAPIRFGDYMAKLSLVPVSSNLLSRKGEAIDLGDPDVLRNGIAAFFAHDAATWELRAQLCTDLKTMPIEDPSVAWPEDESAYRTVATIRAMPQASWSDATRRLDDRLSFTPWHALAAHRPLGAIMRVRQAVYTASAQLRARQNGVELVEPKSLDDLARVGGDTR